MDHSIFFARASLLVVALVVFLRVQAAAGGAKGRRCRGKFLVDDRYYYDTYTCSDPGKMRCCQQNDGGACCSSESSLRAGWVAIIVLAALLAAIFALGVTCVVLRRRRARNSEKQVESVGASTTSMYIEDTSLYMVKPPVEITTTPVDGEDVL